MSIYDKGLRLKYNFTYEKMKMPLIALGTLIVAVVVVLIIMSLISIFQPKPVEFHFEKNPISTNEQTHLIVIVTNTTDVDAENVTVTASAKLSEQIQVSAVGQNEFSIIEKGKWRRVSFLINPVNEIPVGTYSIIIETKINNLDIEEEAVLEIE